LPKQYKESNIPIYKTGDEAKCRN